MPEPAPYLTPAELLAAVPVLNKISSPTGDELDDLLEQLVAEFEDLAERYRGVAFTLRTAEVTRRLLPSTVLRVPHPKLAAVTSATVDGVELDETGLAALQIDGEAGMIVRPAGWGAVAVVAYEHGYEAPPAAVLRACKEFVRARATELTGDAQRNAAAYSDPSGFSYRELSASWAKGFPTGLRAVDDALNGLPDYRTPGLG